MPDKYYYLAIDFAVVCIPLLFSFHPRIRFSRYLLHFAIACALTMIPFIVWDIAFTRVGIWGFNPRYVTGIGILGLPIEEWLFFICIPFACVFVYHSFGLLKTFTSGIREYWVCGVVSILFLAGAAIWRNQAYTCLTFLLTGILLGWLSWVQRPLWLTKAAISYIAVAPFFFLSNGLLTGAWIPEQIVWYNDEANLGLRLGTIPVEDLVYGFLLVLLTITMYERLKRQTR